jgi:hypothetical protein
MRLAVDGPSEEEPRQLEVVLRNPVCLLQEDYCHFNGNGEMPDYFEFGDGKALDVELEH